MQSQASNVLPLDRIANAVEREFPLAARIENTRAVMYFPSDAARIERAAVLVSDGIAVVFKPALM